MKLNESVGVDWLEIHYEGEIPQIQHTFALFDLPQDGKFHDP